MIIQSQQSFVRMNISHWIMYAIVVKAVVQLYCSGTVKKVGGGAKMSFDFSEWTVQLASSHDFG